MRSSATLALASAFLLAACSSDVQTDETSESFSTAGHRPKLPGTWGGADRARWRPEAALANAASIALNTAWTGEGVRDVVVAVPLRLWNSERRPYGDGQSNAVPSFEGFPAKDRVPVVGVLVHRDDGARVTIRFDRALGSMSAAEIRGGTSTNEANEANDTTMTIPATVDANGDAIVEWTPAATIAGDLAIRPQGWNDWFALSFEHPSAFAASLGVPLDREHVGVEHAGADDTATTHQRLVTHSFATSYNARGTGVVPPFVSPEVHARFPYDGRDVVTAVGGSSVWVADDRPQGHKSMYGCFTARDAAAESSAPDGAVASGSGWHRIGDPAESIVNDLEKEPIVVAHGKAASSAPPSAAWAYGLSDVATFRWLMPGEAFTAARGTYHWFLIHPARPFCMELLAHPEG